MQVKRNRGITMLGKKRNKEKENGELLIQHIFTESLAYIYY